MSRSNMNCQAVSIILKIMFYRVFFALAIYTSRGTCVRGDIWIANAFGLSRYIVFHFYYSRQHFFFVIFLLKFVCDWFCVPCAVCGWWVEDMSIFCPVRFTNASSGHNSHPFNLQVRTFCSPLCRELWIRDWLRNQKCWRCHPNLHARAHFAREQKNESQRVSLTHDPCLLNCGMLSTECLRFRDCLSARPPFVAKG